MRCVRAFIVSLCALALLVPVTVAQWPTTCVELNDIVEAHLGNDNNVGIYQRVFGDQAEQACQNDHRDDVRSVFAWAIGTSEPTMSGPAPTPVPTPQPAPAPVYTNWRIETLSDSLTGSQTRIAYNDSASGEQASIIVRCRLSSQELESYFNFTGYVYLADYGDDGLPVGWRWNDDADFQTGRWYTSDSGESVFVPDWQIGELAYGFIHAGKLVFRVVDDSGDSETSTFRFTGSGAPDHPVRQVFQACGQSV